MSGGHSVPTEVAGRWSDLITDLEATAAELDSAGYDVVAVHAGDVTPISEESTVNVLVPDDELDRVKTLVAEAVPDEFAVYTATEGRVTFAVIAAQDPDRHTAVCWPVFVTATAVEELADQAQTTGQITFRLRPLADDEAVRFVLSEPALLLGESQAETEGGK
jgi:hypothetical protein